MADNQKRDYSTKGHHLVKLNVGLLFFFSAHHLMKLCICTKFLEYILNGFPDVHKSTSLMVLK